MFKSYACWFVMALSPFVCMAAGGAATVEVDATVGREVRAVVEAQLKAFAAEKPAQAFSYATPSIQSQFGDAATFMEMVRRSYPMLMHPAAVGFFRPEAGQGVITLGVQLRDGDGNFWRAIYQLEKQPDKSWRINGCVVSPDNPASST